MENGKVFTMEAEGASKENIYIQSAELNGKPYTKNYIHHEDIMNGGYFRVIMGKEPNKNWGNKEEDCIPDLMK